MKADIKRVYLLPWQWKSPRDDEARVVKAQHENTLGLQRSQKLDSESWKRKSTGDLHTYLCIIGNGICIFILQLVEYTRMFCNTLFSCKIVNMMGCWLTYVFISKYSHLVFTILNGVRGLCLASLVSGWFPFKEKRVELLCSSVFFLISASSYWSSVTDA